jgi:hypothetical protein
MLGRDEEGTCAAKGSRFDLDMSRVSFTVIGGLPPPAMVDVCIP